MTLQRPVSTLPMSEMWREVCGQHWKGDQRPARVPHHPPKKKGCSPQNFNASLFSPQNQVQSRKRPDELTDLGSLKSPKKSTKNPKRLLRLARRVSLKLGYFQIWNKERGWVNSIRYRYCEKMVPPPPFYCYRYRMLCLG